MIRMEQREEREPNRTLLPSGTRGYMTDGNRNRAIASLRSLGYDYFNKTEHEDAPYGLEYKATDAALKILIRRMIDEDSFTAEQINHLYNVREKIESKELRELIEEAYNKIPNAPSTSLLSRFLGIFSRKN